MPNITDVAKSAGVSVATVSRYIRSPEKVAAKTALKVAQAIATLDYTPNILARNFSESRSYTVMVLVPDLTNPFLVNVIQGIEKIGRALGYQFLLTEISPLSPDFNGYFNKPEAKFVDGVIQIFSTLPESYDLEKTATPVVILIDCQDDHPCTSVTINDRQAAEVMVKHLISIGHTNIVNIQGPHFVRASAKRNEGYVRAMGKAGLRPQIIVSESYSLENGYELAQKFCELEPRPTAVFCQSDVLAMGFIKGLQTFGLRVPEDVSVAGFDGIGFSKFFSPALTTIYQPAHDLGAKAMETLVDLIKNPEKRWAPAKSILLPWELIVRESTAPPGSKP